MHMILTLSLILISIGVLTITTLNAINLLNLLKATNYTTKTHTENKNTHKMFGA